MEKLSGFLILFLLFSGWNNFSSLVSKKAVILRRERRRDSPAGNGVCILVSSGGRTSQLTVAVSTAA